jgi:hypothetical protein
VCPPSRHSAIDNQFDGFNVDWEPTQGNITNDDAIAYASFLDQFSKAMHLAGKVVSVDVASWCVAQPVCPLSSLFL